MRRITTTQEADDALAEEQAVIFKFSTRCPISLAAQMEVERFASESPGVPVYGIDVLRARSVSLHVSERTGIRHESPQAIVIENGSPAWHGSHMQVTRGTLHERVAGG